MIRALPPQSIAIYQALSKTDVMTAKKLGLQLGILPQAAYRAIRPLEELGVVKPIGKYPKKYKICASEDSLTTYLKMAQENYLKTFLTDSKKESLAQLLQVEFIQNRTMLVQKTIADLQNAKFQVDSIVSGEEVSAELVLARKDALTRGIQQRFIVQKVDEFKRYMFGNWKKLGLQVRYFPLLEARIIIIDKRIVYIMSYNPEMNEEAVGVRFDYPPIAQLMNEVFEKRWNQASEV
jgi:sugar-specific transcriptional regulator TrmB